MVAHFGRNSWQIQPKMALHGHALSTSQEAECKQSLIVGSGSNSACIDCPKIDVNAPISSEETLFSTREDVSALSTLFRAYPYPRYPLFCRKGHGFFLLSERFVAITLLLLFLIATTMFSLLAACRKRDNFSNHELYLVCAMLQQTDDGNKMIR